MNDLEELNLSFILCTGHKYISINNVIHEVNKQDNGVSEGGSYILNPVKILAKNKIEDLSPVELNYNILKKNEIARLNASDIESKIEDKKLTEQINNLISIVILKNFTKNIKKVYVCLIMRSGIMTIRIIL